jgi:GAF domain-containing protein
MTTLSYIGHACQELLAKGFTDDAVLLALEQVGTGARVDRVYIFERHESAGGGATLCSQRYEWSADHVAPQLDNPELQNVNMDEAGPSWVEAFARDRPIASLVRDQPSPVREILESQAIQSICVCPITVGREWWGFVGVDDCHSERVWPFEEVRALQRLSNALAATLRRNQTASRLQTAAAQMRELVREHPFPTLRPRRA